MADPRVVDTLAARSRQYGPPMPYAGWAPSYGREIAARRIELIEAAGLTVIDTADAALIERVARALWDGTSEHLPMYSAHRVLAALRGDS